ncbi:HNH endonuclease signature motif containing protein [Cohnella lubricantis]|uniref:HNH endonuclease n=1 Tax=Cohnella lubricantis TaxID=2163172 RepID=A0A841T861_9BACL|nr:HNH endonuclease signature motif containing protein [Cohnella lubricantis]MBB6677504.1 HNH endonuclease [Cohnella lubricantis]MBP2116610.1 hypothetical protein [Cohnella lubricantis]
MAGLAPEVKDFIRANHLGTPFPELVRLVQDRFGESSAYNQIRAFVHNNKLWNGLDTRIKPGNVPFNKGKPRTWAGGEETRFKKGHRPKNYMPVGSERINTDGYIDVKIADPNKWTQVHLLIWEAVNGPIPKGHVVIFADANKFNVHPDNLVLVSRSQLARLNQNHLIKGSAELTKVGIVIADLKQKISDRRVKGKKGPMPE